MKLKWKKEIYLWGKAIIISVIIVIICRIFLFTPIVVIGKSMSPTLKNNDKILVSKLSQIHRFDDIVFLAPDRPGISYVKRVIGLPGDIVEVKNDVLYINKKKYSEPYIKIHRQKDSKLMGNFTLSEQWGRKTVPDHAYFVLGDNRLYSNDSRNYGFVKQQNVIGKVSARFYPFTNITFFK